MDLLLNEKLDPAKDEEAGFFLHVSNGHTEGFCTAPYGRPPSGNGFRGREHELHQSKPTISGPTCWQATV